jgi:hypothetical protein
MDQNSLIILIATAAGSAGGSAKLIEKILGPTAEYIGEGIQVWTEKRVSNLGRIFNHCWKKLGDRIDSEGTVPPKVLKTILVDGSFAEDELTAEYFGGVLASSRSEVSRDDRGAVFAALVGRLSTYQIRAHYVFYSLVKELFDGQSLNVGFSGDRSRMSIFVPLESFILAMDFSSKEQEHFNQLTGHALFGLVKEDLIGENYTYAREEEMKRRFGDKVRTGLVFTPTGLGVELFLWAHGRGDLHVKALLEPEITFSSETKINIPAGYFALRTDVQGSASAAASDSYEC